MRKVSTAILVLLALTAACSSGNRDSQKSPIDDVSFEVDIKSMEWKSQHNSTFVFIDLRVRNESGSPLDIDISKIAADLDGSRSKYTYFDSLGSVEPGVETVAVGGADFALYFVFPGRIESEPRANLKIVEFGLVNH